PASRGRRRRSAGQRLALRAARPVPGGTGWNPARALRRHRDGRLPHGGRREHRGEGGGQVTALVTGGAGFVGQALVARLAASGERGVVLDNLLQYRDRQPPELPAELVVGDVRDRALVASLLERERPKTVFHLAAIHFIPACDADPAECISVNTAGTAALLQACASFEQRPACVLVSTGAVYAPASQAHREDETPGPVDVYGMSKLWMEQIAGLFVARNGLRISVARLFNTYGPGE